MNKLHSFAGIAFAAIGIFFVARLVDNMIMIGSMMVFSGLDGTKVPLMFVLATVGSLILLGLCLGAILYLCLCRREQLAERIVGPDEVTDVHVQVDWLYVAFRLVCITAGLYCLHGAAWRFIYALHRYLVSRAFRYDSLSRFFSTEFILGWFALLAIGTYLVCGAPHFVRWHVKKTLEQCRLNEQKQEFK